MPKETLLAFASTTGNGFLVVALAAVAEVVPCVQSRMQVRGQA